MLRRVGRRFDFENGADDSHRNRKNEQDHGHRYDERQEDEEQDDQEGGAEDVGAPFA